MLETGVPFEDGDECFHEGVGHLDRAVTGRPSSTVSEVTPLSAMPHGTMRSKQDRSVETLKARPWLVIQREMRTPIAPILRSPTHAPLKPGDAIGGDPVGRAQPDHHRFEIAHVAMDVLPVRLEIEDGIGDQLSGAVIGDVAAAAGLDHVDAARGQHFRCRDDVRARFSQLHAERDDMGVFEQQQRVGDALGTAIFDERLLQVERGRVRDDAEAADNKITHKTLPSRLRAFAPS